MIKIDLGRIAKVYHAGFIILGTCLVILMNSGKYLTTMKTPVVHKASLEHGNALRTTCESVRFASERSRVRIPSSPPSKNVDAVGFQPTASALLAIWLIKLSTNPKYGLIAQLGDRLPIF